MAEVVDLDAIIPPIKVKRGNDPRVAVLNGDQTPDPRGIPLTPAEQKAKALFTIPEKPISSTPPAPAEAPTPTSSTEMPLDNSPVPGMSTAELAANAKARLAATTINEDLVNATVKPGIVERASEVFKPITRLIRSFTERRKLAKPETEEEGPLLYKIPPKYL